MLGIFSNQIELSMHEEKFKELVGILSDKTCLCLQMSRSTRVEYSYTGYIVSFYPWKGFHSRHRTNGSKINHKMKTLIDVFFAFIQLQKKYQKLA